MTESGGDFVETVSASEVLVSEGLVEVFWVPEETVAMALIAGAVTFDAFEVVGVFLLLMSLEEARLPCSSSLVPEETVEMAMGVGILLPLMLLQEAKLSSSCSLAPEETGEMAMVAGAAAFNAFEGVVCILSPLLSLEDVEVLAVTGTEAEGIIMGIGAGSSSKSEELVSDDLDEFDVSEEEPEELLGNGLTVRAGFCKLKRTLFVGLLLSSVLKRLVGLSESEDDESELKMMALDFISFLLRLVVSENLLDPSLWLFTDVAVLVVDDVKCGRVL